MMTGTWMGVWIGCVPTIEQGRVSEGGGRERERERERERVK